MFFPSTENLSLTAFFWITPTINKLPYSHVETCRLSRAALRGEEDARKARKEKKKVRHVCGNRFTESNIEGVLYLADSTSLLLQTRCQQSKERLGLNVCLMCVGVLTSLFVCALDAQTRRLSF